MLDRKGCLGNLLVTLSNTTTTTSVDRGHPTSNTLPSQVSQNRHVRACLNYIVGNVETCSVTS